MGVFLNEYGYFLDAVGWGLMCMGSRLHVVA